VSLLLLDSAPVMRWLDEEVLPQYGSTSELARALAERTGIQPRSWQRQLRRLKARSRIEFFALDRLCCLLGEHVSRFCDLSDFQETSL